jgi:Domain of unknown function (DUF4430)
LPARLTAIRGGAVASALLGFCGLAAAGCGLGPGASLPGVRLTVSRDFGSRPLLSRSVGSVTEADTVMRVLERSAAISTRYGGGFVQSINGLEGGQRGGERYDWFFYVNGVESTVGAAAYPLRGGESIWWDYRDWSAAESVPAVVGSWPEPFTDGYDGRRRPVAVECLGGGAACAEVGGRLEAAGASLARQAASGAIRVLVGPWARVRSDAAVAQIEAGPQASGVFAQVAPRGRGYEFQGLAEDGRPVRAFGAAVGLVAATRSGEDPPTWVVTGTTAAAVSAAAGLLDGSDLRDHYAVATEAGKETALPLRTP